MLDDRRRGTSTYIKSPRKSMNAAGEGRLERTLERQVKPGIDRGWATGLYGKLAFTAILSDQLSDRQTRNGEEIGVG